MADIHNFKPNQIVYDYSPTLEMSFEVKIIEVGIGYVIASWNGMTPRRYTEAKARKWKLRNKLK